MTDARAGEDHRVLDLGAVDPHFASDRGVRADVGVDDDRPGADHHRAPDPGSLERRRGMDADLALDVRAVGLAAVGARAQALEREPVGLQERVALAGAAASPLRGHAHPVPILVKDPEEIGQLLLAVGPRAYRVRVDSAPGPRTQTPAAS